MNNMLRQIKFAWHNLKKKPGFVSSVIITMGLTLGALLCVLTLAYVILFKPLPYPDAERLFRVDSTVNVEQRKPLEGLYSYPGLMDLYQRQDVFSTSAVVINSNDVESSLAHTPAMKVSFAMPEFFPMMGAKYAIGRGFEQTEAIDSFNPVTVISYSTWKNEFDLRQDILSQSLTFSGVTYRIIGVLAESFAEPAISYIGYESDAWLTWDYNFRRDLRDNWAALISGYILVGKLQPTISHQQAEQKLSMLLNETWQQNTTSHPHFKNSQTSVTLTSLKDIILSDSQSMIYLLLIGIVGLVVIACANVTNLFMSRTAEKKQQLAIFAALGAKKSHLFTTLFAESLLLMSLSIMVAMGIALGGFELIHRFFTAIFPRVTELSLNGFMLIAATVIAVSLAFIFARISSNMINYRALNTALQSGGKGTQVQVSKRVRQILIVSQVAIATVLILVNTSLFREAAITMTQPLGFNTENSYSLGLSYSGRPRPPAEQVQPIINELINQLAEQPEVQMATQSNPPFNAREDATFTLVGHEEPIVTSANMIGNDYFSLLEQPLLQGREFTKTDLQAKAQVVVINAELAAQISAINPNTEVLNSQIYFGKNPLTIIGIVQNAQLPWHKTVQGKFNLPMREGSTGFLIKLHPKQHLSRERIGELLKKIDPKWTVWDYVNLHDLHLQYLFPQIIMASTTGALALLTLLLAAVGLYGILSYSTQMRKTEIATRLAIGAKRKAIFKLMVKDNVGAILLGIILGTIILLSLFIGFSEVLQDYLSYALIFMFVLTISMVGLVSLGAAYLPLRRYFAQPISALLRGE